MDSYELIITNSEEENLQLVPCSICGRTFRPESLEKHYKACERNATKKRKVFDSTIQRYQGTDLGEYLPQILDKKRLEATCVNTNCRKIVEYIESKKEKISSASQKVSESVESKKEETRAKGGLSSSQHERCPHCDRSFGPKAFDRHVEWCKEQRGPIPLTPDTLKARERLEARINYQAPSLNKNRKKLHNEKNTVQTEHQREICYSNSENRSYNFDPNRGIFQRSKIRESSSAPSCNYQHINKRQSLGDNRMEDKHLNDKNIPNTQQYSYLSTDNVSRERRVKPFLTESSPSIQVSDDELLNRQINSLVLYDMQEDLDCSEENKKYLTSGNMFISQNNSSKENQSYVSAGLLCAKDSFTSTCSDSSLGMSGDKFVLSNLSSREEEPILALERKLPKFCHECGSKYPIQTAKFCCECGEQRLVIKS